MLQIINVIIRIGFKHSHIHPNLLFFVFLQPYETKDEIIYAFIATLLYFLYLHPDKHKGTKNIWTEVI